MKKLLLLLCVFSFGFSAYVIDPAIRIDSTKTRVILGREAIMLQAQAKGISASPNQTLTWYVDDMAGFNTIGYYGAKVMIGSGTSLLTRVGNATINAQAVYRDGTALYGVSAQTIANGATLTAIKSPYYKFTYTVPTINAANMSFSFFVKD